MTFDSPQELSDLNYALLAATTAAEHFMEDQQAFEEDFVSTKQRAAFKERVERWRDMQRKTESLLGKVISD